MKITVEFENLAEFQKYMGQTAPAPAKDDQPDINRVTGAAPEEVQEDAQEPQEAPEAPKPKKNTKKAEKPAPAAAEPAEEAEDEPAASAPAVTEDFRVEVRRKLAALNKKTGYNRAAEIIKEQTGSEAKLTEVALADLPKIMDAVKAELAKKEDDNAD